MIREAVIRRLEARDTFVAPLLHRPGNDRGITSAELVYIAIDIAADARHLDVFLSKAFAQQRELAAFPDIWQDDVTALQIGMLIEGRL